MSDLRSIGASIRREQKRLWHNSPGLGLQALWEEAAGSEIAAHARVRSCRAGVVTVACDSGAWACELALQAELLADRINQLKPQERVQKIRFVNAAGGNQNSRK
ncbi:MAG: DciA family protein [Thermoleophilia bacterium]